MFNVVFLDLDGVVNSQTFYRDRVKTGKKENEFNPKLVKMVSDFIHKHNAKVVISSTHRSDGIDALQKKLDSYGFECKIFDLTGFSKCRVRGYEIREWISNNKRLVKNYVIFDDDSDMLLNQAKHFFKCDNYTGITPNVLYRAGRFLRGEI
jgi:hypothetical protein